MSESRNSFTFTAGNFSTKLGWYSKCKSFLVLQENPSWTLGVIYIMGYVVQQEAGNSSLSVLFLSTVTMLLSGLSRCQFPGSCMKAGLSETSGKALEFIYVWLKIYAQLSFVALCGRCLSSTIDAIWGGPWHQYIQANFQPVPWTDMCPDFPTGVVTLLLGILTSLGLETNRQFRHGYHVASFAIVFLLTLLLFMPRHEQDTSFNALDLNLLEASAICCLPMSGALALTSPNEARPKLLRTDKRPLILGFTVLTQFLSLGLTTLVYTMCSTTKPLAWFIPIQNLNTPPIMHLLLSLLCLLALSLAIVDVFSQTWPLVRNLAVNGFIWPVFHKENPLTQTPVKCIAFVTLASTCLSVIAPTKTLLCGTLLPLLVGNVFTTVYIIRRSYSPFALILQKKSHDITLVNTSSYQRMDPRPLPDEPDIDQIVLEYLGLSKPGNPNQKPFKAALVRRLIAVLLISQIALALTIRCITLQPHFFGFAAGSLALVWVVCVGWLHYQPRVNLQFQVSFPPFLTATASLLNCLLLAHLSLSTWVATITWTTIGVLLYVGYGKTHNRAKARMTNPQPVLQLGTWSHPATVRHIHIQPSSPTENPDNYPYLQFGDEASNDGSYERF